MTAKTIVNFGGNVTFQPRHAYAPADEAEVLKILAEHRGQRIRAIGSLHSWSEATVANEVLLTLEHLNHVRVIQEAGRTVADVGAGCQLKHLLAELEAQGGWMLPSLGLITEQTIAGATSTGTHGSGGHSLSHYLVEVRVATYDANGDPVIRTFDSGVELQAARCALGCLGIVVSVKILCRPIFRIEERVGRYQNVDDVLAAEDNYPLQQFFYFPWTWEFGAQHRRETTLPRSGSAWLYRDYWFYGIDIGLHLIVLMMVQALKSSLGVRFFFRHLFTKFVIFNWTVVDKAVPMLIMEHELFRHIEIEIFVRRPELPATLEFVRDIVSWFAGDVKDVTPKTQQMLDDHHLPLPVKGWGSYTHHYPICVRRIFPDDTLISPASGPDGPWYAVSFISYARPADRAGFLGFTTFLARAGALLFQARPHWGKVCPIDHQTATQLYPHLPAFREVCESVDPLHRFRNDWVEAVLFGGKTGNGEGQSSQRAI